MTFTQGPCTYNQFFYNVCTETSANFNSLELEPGTYWVNVQNASVTNDDPVFWDENSGVGCMSSGCPSQAEAPYVGTIPSESFTLLGNDDPAPQCFKSQDNLQIISNLTQMQAGTSGQNGVVVNRAGNVYGTFPNGGSNSAGLAFKLSDRSGLDSRSAVQLRGRQQRRSADRADRRPQRQPLRRRARRHSELRHRWQPILRSRLQPDTSADRLQNGSVLLEREADLSVQQRG